MKFRDLAFGSLITLGAYVAIGGMQMQVSPAGYPHFVNTQSLQVMDNSKTKCLIVYRGRSDGVIEYKTVWNSNQQWLSDTAFSSPLATVSATGWQVLTTN